MSRLPCALARGKWAAVREACLIGCLAVLPASGAVAAPGPPRLEYLFSVPQDQSEHLFMDPLGLAVDSATQRIYVADTSHHQVQVFSMAGVPQYAFKHWVKYHTGERVLGEPWRLLPGEHGAVLVSDLLSDHIDEMDAFGNTGDSIDVTTLMGGKERAAPGAMDRDAAGNLCVLNETTGQILVLDKARHRRLTYGAEGVAGRRFKSVVDIAVAPDGTVYSLDSVEDHVIRVFDSTGHFLRGFGRHGFKDADFHMPSALALDHAGRLWISDMVSRDVKLYTTDGKFLTTFGGMGTGRGEFYFPCNVAVTRDVLCVLERAGAQLQAFRIVGP